MQLIGDWGEVSEGKKQGVLLNRMVNLTDLIIIKSVRLEQRLEEQLSKQRKSLE